MTLWLFIGCILAAMWSFGCVVLPLWGAHTLWAEDDMQGLCALMLFIGFPVGCLLAVLPWGLYADSQSPTLATLQKDRWECTASHSETTTSHVMVGKVMVPQTNTHNVCDQYGKKG